MRTWISSGICILVSATVGFAIGVGTWASMSAFYSPIAGKIYVTTGGFDSLFDGMARLGADETLASKCDGKGDLKFALDNEAQTIRVLQNSARTARLAPPLEVASARLSARNAVAGRQTDREAERLLRSAGWRNTSESHMREIIEALDQDHCAGTSGGSRPE